LITGKRILITGAAGFIGSHLTRRFLEEGNQVVVLVKQSSDLWRIQDIINQIEIHHSDLSSISIDSLKSTIKKTHFIYHLGAAGVNQSQENCSSLINTNVLSTISLLQLARGWNVTKFVYCGSCFEYGEGSSLTENNFPAPINEYSASKLAAGNFVNMFFRKYNVPTVYLRPFTVYGQFEGLYRLIPHVICHALDGNNVELTGGEQKRDMIFIDDVVEGFLASGIAPGISGEIFNLSTGQEVSVKEIVSIIIKLMGSSIKPIFGARPYRKSELWSLSGDPSKAKKALNWKTNTSLKNGLQKTIDWFEKNRSKYPAYTKKVINK